jgi:hypothetical protein
VKKYRGLSPGDDELLDEGWYHVVVLAQGGDVLVYKLTAGERGERVDRLKHTKHKFKNGILELEGVSTTYMREVGLPRDKSIVKWTLNQAKVV